MSTELKHLIEERAERLVSKAKLFDTGTRGRVSTIWVYDRVVAIKAALDGAPPNMVRNESTYTRAANECGVGPTALYYDSEQDVFFRSFVTGFSFDNWVRYRTQYGLDVRPVLSDIFEQCYALDDRGLQRPELSRPHKDILVKGQKAVIIDFERCSFSEDHTNVLHFTECLLRKRYASMLGVSGRTKKKKSLRSQLRSYKKSGRRETFEDVKETVLDWVTG